MRVCLFSAFLAISMLGSIAQNLVLNGSFEDFTSCPSSYSQISRAPDWRELQASPDYMHSCNTGDLSVPDNVYGSQNARTGEGYIGLLAYFSGGDAREYAYSPLICPLDSGSEYYMEFYVSLAERSEYSVATIGALFTSDPQPNPNKQAIEDTPQVESPVSNAIIDVNDWTKISGYFTAEGNYTHIVIGNFQTEANSNITEIDDPGTGLGEAYYYIEDVLIQPVNPEIFNNHRRYRILLGRYS